MQHHNDGILRQSSKPLLREHVNDTSGVVFTTLGFDSNDLNVQEADDRIAGKLTSFASAVV